MKPILFNTEMVKAILEDRKTNTRRIMKPQPSNKIGTYIDPYNKNYKRFTMWTGCKMHLSEKGNVKNTCHWCPKYLPGDILYVRETTCIDYEFDDENGTINYKADYTPQHIKIFFTEQGLKWTPSIHMLKKHARIFLKVTDVRVERLQDMDTNDYISEGILVRGKYEDEIYDLLEQDFSELWESTIKKDKLKLHGWEANPYVFVYEFKRTEGEANG